MKTLRVALAQINTTVGDLAGNAGASSSTRSVPENRAPISWPFRSWPCPAIRRRTCSCAATSSTTTSARCTKSRLKSTASRLVTGFVDFDVDIYNAAAVIARRRRRRHLPQAVPAELRRLRREALLPRRRPPRRSSRSPAPESASTSARTSGTRRAPPRLRPWPAPTSSSTSTARPFHKGKRRSRERWWPLGQPTTPCMLCYVNMVGGQDELVFDGNSIVFDQNGDHHRPRARLRGRRSWWSTSTSMASTWRGCTSPLRRSERLETARRARPSASSCPRRALNRQPR